MPAYLVTGAAGFIGSKVCEYLLRDGHTVIGIDNFDPVYDLRLKEFRLEETRRLSHLLLSSKKASATGKHCRRSPGNTPKSTEIINLAAKAGVRDSVLDPVVLLRHQPDRHAQPAGSLPSARDQEIHPGFHLQHLRPGRTLPYAGNGRLQPAPAALRRQQESGRDAQLQLSLSA